MWPGPKTEDEINRRQNALLEQNSVLVQELSQMIGVGSTEGHVIKRMRECTNAISCNNMDLWRLHEARLKLATPVVK